MTKILFYRYGNICEPDVIDCFVQAGLTVEEERTQIEKKDTTQAETAKTVSALLTKSQYLFVFSVNFFPALAEVCKVVRIPYVFWTVDCPVMELYSPALAHGCNRAFFFDRAQYETFAPRMGRGRAWHLPLATDPLRSMRVVEEAGGEGKKRFAADVSFVGSLYNEKNRFREIENEIGDYARGYCHALLDAQTRVPGADVMSPGIGAALIEKLEAHVPALQGSLCEGSMEAKQHYITHMLLDWESTQRERESLLEAAASRCRLSLYTHSDAKAVPHAQVKAPVKTLTEMPLVFHHSKINLNITMRAITTGLPLRVYDICGAGGFLLSDWQEELAEQFVIGEEVECFSSEEEMLDKIGFYLTHDDIRAKIAQKGYERICRMHTYAHRIRDMIVQITGA